MAPKYEIGQRVKVLMQVTGGTIRTPFFVRGKKGVIVASHGPVGNPRELAYGNRNAPRVPLYGVSFHMAHLYDEDPDILTDRVVVDIWEDWLVPNILERADTRPIDREEHGLSYYDRRIAALGNLLNAKGFMNIDESRRLVAELDYERRGTEHPMVNHE
ncbi:MAG: nitrile hydratase subunit beta [Dehalococcoidia bacterium]|nr:nitrile hydratase subunit beta [Dehalococcoidia bacterium]